MSRVGLAPVVKLVLVSLLVCSAGADGQEPPGQPPPSQPTFRTGVGLVRVDVTVTDDDGRPVTDLGVDDFELREDGVLQTIQLLQFQYLTGEPASGDDRSLEIRSPEHAAQEAAREDVRLLVIFVDDYHIRSGPLFDHQLRRMLRRFIDEAMRPTDLFAIMGPLTPLSALRLTRDRRVMLEHIDTLQGRLGGFVPPRSPVEEAQIALGGRQLGRIRAQVTLSALEALAVHLGGLRVGRKSVLFISEGPPLQAGGMPMFDRLEDVIAAANRSNVTIHALDPRELDVYGVVGAAGTANASLAAATGGRELGRSNDHSRGLKAVMADASAYYLLGYTPSRDPADGRFHEIEVKVRRRGVRVLARKGYWAPAPEEIATAKGPEPPAGVLAARATLARIRRAGAVMGWVGVSPTRGGRATLTIVCEASAKDAPEVAAIVASLAGDGSPGTLLARRTDVPHVWMGQLEALEGVHEVTVTVRDAAGQVLEGWRQEARVPGPGELQSKLGTLLVYRPLTVASYGLLMAGADVPPTPERRFRRTDRVVVRLPVADAHAPETVTAALANMRGETLTALPVSQSVGGLPQVELPVRSLAQAEYVLTLSASFEEGTVSERMAFAIVP